MSVQGYFFFFKKQEPVFFIYPLDVIPFFKDFYHIFLPWKQLFSSLLVDFFWRGTYLQGSKYYFWTGTLWSLCEELFVYFPPLKSKISLFFLPLHSLYVLFISPPLKYSLSKLKGLRLCATWKPASLPGTGLGMLVERRRVYYTEQCSSESTGISVLVLPAPASTGRHGRPCGTCTCSGRALQEGSPDLREPESFVRGSKQAWALLQIETYLYYISNYSAYTAQGDTISVFRGCSAYKHPWKYSPE